MELEGKSFVTLQANLIKKIPTQISQSTVK